MDTIDTRERARRRNRDRIDRLKHRAALFSTLGFAAFLGLAAQHAVGSSKRRVTDAASPRAAPVAPTYFDQRAEGFAFDDGSSASSVAPPPPIAQTSVS